MRFNHFQENDYDIILFESDEEYKEKEEKTNKKPKNNSKKNNINDTRITYENFITL